MDKYYITPFFEVLEDTNDYLLTGCLVGDVDNNILDYVVLHQDSNQYNKQYKNSKLQERHVYEKDFADICLGYVNNGTFSNQKTSYFVNKNGDIYTVNT